MSIGSVIKKAFSILLLFIATIVSPNPSLFGRTRFIVSQNDDLVKAFTAINTKFVIKENINLGGKTIRIGMGSILVFKGGCLFNGTVFGNGTQIKETTSNIFRNCRIEGSWALPYSCSSMFDNDLSTVLLLKNLSVLSPNIRLSSNRTYSVDAQGETINVESISSADKTKPLIVFHTTNPNVEGLVLIGKRVSLKNIRFIDDYNINNDVVFGKNIVTTGSMFSIRSTDNVVQSLLIQGCDFSGGTSSSFVSSSQTRNCLVDHCTFSGYMGDHAIYCSMKVESFVVQNCYINDITHTSALFKIRSSKDIRSFIIRNIEAHNLNGYLVNVSLLETPTSELLFENITLTKDDDCNAVFYGFCISDETKDINGKSYNANQITVRDCKFDYGYDGAPIIYPGSGVSPRVKAVRYIQTNARQSSFTGGNADYLEVKNSCFEDCISKVGMVLQARRISIEDSIIKGHLKSRGCLFLVNYTSDLVETIEMNNVVIDANVNHLFSIVKGDSINVKLDKCSTSSPINQLFYAPKSIIIDFTEGNNRIVKSPSFQIIGRKR